MVQAGRGHQVTEVVRLEVEPVGQRLVRATLQLGDLRGGVQVAVGALRLGDQRDQILHAGIQLRVIALCQERDGCLEPLVEVAVQEGGALVSAVGATGGHLEVVTGSAQYIVEQVVAHGGNRAVTNMLEALGPGAEGECRRPHGQLRRGEGRSVHH
nr:hypothetical protein [Tessaracoccus defluvii]